MVEALFSERETSSGSMADMRVLPLDVVARDQRLIPCGQVGRGGEAMANDLEQGIIRPSDELADPGPRGRIDFVPAMCVAGALMIDNETDIDATRDNGWRR